MSLTLEPVILRQVIGYMVPPINKLVCEFCSFFAEMMTLLLFGEILDGSVTVGTIL